MIDGNTLDFSSSWFLVAKMTWAANKFLVEITDDDAGRLDQAVYAWRTPLGQVLRFGTSQGPVMGRLRQYPKHFNDSLAGKEKPTPRWEAEAWRAQLVDNGAIFAMVHQPEEVHSVAGPLRPFLDIERALIRRFQPVLNRSHR